jgi:PAS domain S-box-containing protein
MGEPGFTATGVPPPDARPGRRGGTSLRSRVNRGLVWGLSLQLVLVVLIIGTAVVAAVDGLRADADRRMEVAAASLLAGMADQQSGLLAYVNSPTERDPLLVYTQGQQETDTSLRDLRTQAAATSQAAAAAQVESDARAWERWAEGARLQVRSTGLPLTDPAAVGDGRQLFAVFRTDQQSLVSRLEADSPSGTGSTLGSTLVKAAMVVIGSLAMVVVLQLTARRVVRYGLGPLGKLAHTAGEIAAEKQVSIPYVEAGDEVGELARALLGWQESSSVRTILAEQAPVGICRIDAEGRFLTANARLESMLGYDSGQLVGQPFRSLLHPDDLDQVSQGQESLTRGTADHFDVESRWLRRDGSIVWCSLMGAPVVGPDGRSESFVGIMDDISERKQEADRAARIQRDLLPKERPELEGYDLAAVCVPAQDDVAGDFYDWAGPVDGQFDLTLADVMGKGVGSALVMATLRTALRATPHEVSLGACVSQVAESMTRALTDEGLFVTMFHARLNLESGLLHYVDAGHGYGVVLRPNGEFVRLRSRSLPLGVLSGTVYEEQQVQMEPGDMLLVFTDGLVEINDVTIEVAEVLKGLEGAGTAAEAVARLVETVKGQKGDDVTVIALRRMAEPAAAARERQASPLQV